MSHTTTVKLEVRNKEAFKIACENDANVDSFSVESSSHRLYDGTTVNGIFVWFKGWRYPVVFTEQGEAKYDNYGGSWGNQKCLDTFMQNYAGGAFIDAAIQEGYTLVSNVREGDDVVVVVGRDNYSAKATIPVNGDPVVEAIGCSGSACEGLTQTLTGALGSSLNINHKQEYFDREKAHEREAE